MLNGTYICCIDSEPCGTVLSGPKISSGYSHRESVVPPKAVPPMLTVLPELESVMPLTPTKLDAAGTDRLSAVPVVLAMVSAPLAFKLMVPLLYSAPPPDIATPPPPPPEPEI